jgi:ribose transport system substrate-binding protein
MTILGPVKLLAAYSALAIVGVGMAQADVVSKRGGHTVDVGLDAPIKVPADEPLRVGFFIATVANVYVQAMVDEAKKFAADNGFEIEIFDAQFNAQIQMDQLENVLENGDFNAWYVTPIDGNLMCNIVSKDAPAKGILVGTSNIAICGHDELPFEKQWEPGILTYVGAAETYDYVHGWLKAIADDRGDRETNAILIKGFAGLTVTRSAERAAQEVPKDSPNFKIVGEAYGDFTAAVAQAKVETLMLAHPEANVVITQDSDMTVGAINALEDMDKLKDVAVYDVGARKDTLHFIEEGSLRASAPYGPRTHVRQVLGAIQAAWEGGEIPPRVQDGLPYGEAGRPFMVTKENLSQYAPEY